jgi:glycosyltransferase involved in cell wall biosynthesis
MNFSSRTHAKEIRVIVVVSQMTPLLGIESATVSLVEALRQDYEVRVIAIADDPPTINENDLLNFESWGGRVAGWKRLLTVARAFSHRTELAGSTIILSGAWAAIPMLIALPKKLRSGAIVWEHSFDSEKVRTHRKLKVLRAAARPLYSRTRATVTVSESLRQDLRRAGFGGDIEVIANIIRKFDSVEVEDLIPGRLLAVGSLRKTKNYPLALHALAILPAHFSLDILGDGPEWSALERMAVELGIENRVNLYGYVKNPAKHFAQAQIVVHPSLGETYGMVLFEAASFRKPVVAVNQSVMRETIPSLVPGIAAAPQPEAFAAAILSLEETPPSGEIFDEAARKRDLVSQTIVSDWRRLIDGARQ